MLRAKHVAVIGGGNTAMDAVRTAKRLGAEHAYLVYRRTRAEMPARVEEIEHAEEEGIEILMLAAPIVDQRQREGTRHQHALPAHAAGRARRLGPTQPRADSRATSSISRWKPSCSPSARARTRSFATRRPTCASTGRATSSRTRRPGATEKPGVFAGGDIVTGGATVISAMGAGRRAARAIHSYLEHPSVDGHI